MALKLCKGCNKPLDDNDKDKCLSCELEGKEKRNIVGGGIIGLIITALSIPKARKTIFKVSKTVAKAAWEVAKRV